MELISSMRCYLQYRHECYSNLTEAFDKATVEICKVYGNPDVSCWLKFKPGFNSFNSLIFYANPLCWNHKTKKSNLILLKSTFSHVDEKLVFLEPIQALAYDLHMRPTRVFSIDQNIIQIHDDKNVKLFGKNFINIALEASWSIWKIERLNLVLKITIWGPENSFLFFAFSNSHLLVGTSQVQLGKALDLP